MRYIAYLNLPYLQYCSSVKPEQRGLPLAVLENNTVVSMSPELAALGVALRASRRQVKHVCPEAMFVQHDKDASLHLAKGAWDICADYTPLVEPSEVNSAFLDITGCGDARSIVAELSRRCAETLGFTPHICVAPTKLVAKAGVPPISSEERAAWISPDEVLDFLAPLPVQALWPLSKATLEHLWRLGVNSVAQLRAVPVEELIDQLGEEGLLAHRLSLGIDHSRVQAAYPEPSVSCSFRFDQPLDSWDDMLKCLKICAAQISSELDQAQASTSSVELTVQSAGYADLVKRRAALRSPASSAQALESALIRAARAATRASANAPVISLHARATNLSMPAGLQLCMFCPELQGLAPSDDACHADELARAIESIRQRFGAKSVLTADAIVRTRRDRMIAASLL